ncbi:MAG: hypothetical protein ACLFNU_10485 [Bacteroidales bacterium]
MEIVTSIVPQKSFNNQDRQRLLELYQQYFDNVKPQIFFKDLKEKDWIILIQNHAGKTLGFSTIKLIWLPVNGCEQLFLYSGDTIVKEEARGYSALSCAFVKFMFYLINKYSKTLKYWFLITKGYRTYRFLPLYFKEFFPAYYNTNIPKHYKNTLNTIGFYKFGNCYNPDNHIIKLKNDKDYLKLPMANVPESKMNDLHVKYFLEKNPGYYLGDELACIAEICESNFKPAVYKVKDIAKVDLSQV